MEPAALLDALKPKPQARRFLLRTAREVRAEVAKVYREYRTGKIDGATARDSGYLLKIIIDSIRADELEQRVEALELSLIHI